MASASPIVTAQGIRDGDPGALGVLVERRSGAVLGYCEAVCGSDAAPSATAEAFARFRAAVVADPGAGDPDVLLLAATRYAAAAAGRAQSPRQSGLRRRLSRGSGASDACADVPELLAARAGGALGDVDTERLERHLARHDTCRELETAQTRAEARYATPAARAVSIDVLSEVIAALVAAAPVMAAHGQAPPAVHRPGAAPGAHAARPQSPRP